jgi:putative ABC transport system ATP-binding protein
VSYLPGAALIVDDVTKSFSRDAADWHEVLRGVSFEAKSATLVLVKGATGSGRSTLLRCLGGIYRIDGGSIVLRSDVGCVDLATASDRAVAWLRQRYMSLFDGRLLAPPHAAAWRVLSRQAALSERAAHEQLHRVGLAGCANLPVGRLHPPEISVLALAVALSKKASIYLLDEPAGIGGKGENGHDYTITAIKEALKHGATVIATGESGGPLSDLAGITYQLNRD